jgi:carbamoyl-phosphate synthase small subunit
VSALPHRLPAHLDADACLALEDGAFYFGRSFGAPLPSAAAQRSSGFGRGEVVFNTSMAGYQEICTDPSYRGQMVVLTHPQIGNYGVQLEATESTRPWITALIVRDLVPTPNHWLLVGSLGAYLATAGVPGIQAVDTRSLTRHLRTQGTMRAALGDIDRDQPIEPQIEALIELARTTTPLSEQNLVAEVSDPAGIGASTARPVAGLRWGGKQRIALVDCGVKHNIARSLKARGAELTVLSWTASVEEVLASGAQGVVMSNGPGDPARMQQAARLTEGLLDRGVPYLGICLGHQILAIAAGGTTSRLKFGHHGGNHPVRDLGTDRVHITSQNHEFQVDAASVTERSGFRVAMVNLNDGSVEGLAHRDLPAFSVQYHPEGCPGPQDNQYVFERFLRMVEEPRSGWDTLNAEYREAAR